MPENRRKIDRGREISRANHVLIFKLILVAHTSYVLKKHDRKMCTVQYSVHIDILKSDSRKIIDLVNFELQKQMILSDVRQNQKTHQIVVI